MKRISNLILIIISSYLFIGKIYANSNPYGWKNIKEDTDVVLIGTVVSAKMLIKPGEIAIVGKDKIINLIVEVESLLYNRIPFAKSVQLLTIYLTGYKNRIPVGESGAFFLKCNEVCKVVDEQNGTWLTTLKRTGNLGSKTIYSTSIFNVDTLFLFNMPKELWSKHYEWTYSEEKDTEFLVEKMFISEEHFSNTIPKLLSK